MRLDRGFLGEKVCICSYGQEIAFFFFEIAKVSTAMMDLSSGSRLKSCKFGNRKRWPKVSSA